MHNEEQKLCFMQSWSRIHAKTINKIDKHANLTTIYPNLGESSIMEAWGSIICEKFDIIPMLHMWPSFLYNVSHHKFLPYETTNVINI